MRRPFLFVVLLSLILSGCGGSGSSSSTMTTSTESATQATAPTTGSVILNLGAGTAAKPSAIRVLGSRGDGTILFGPTDYPISSRIVVSGLPLQVTSLLFEPLSSGKPADALEHAVRLSAAVPQVIDDPLGSSAPPSSIAVGPDGSSIPIGASQAFVATASYPSGAYYAISDVVAWSTSADAIATVSENVARGVGGGTATITAALDGVSGTASLVVQPAATATTLTSSGTPSIFGTALTLTASVTPATAGGTVTFSDGTTTLGTATLANGRASFTTGALAVGTHTITAAYSGSAGAFLPSTSTAFPQSVNPASVGASVASSAPTAVVGQNVTLTATVTGTAEGGTPSGTVTFLDGATTLAANVALDGAGRAVYASTQMALGAHVITVTYSGDSRYAASTSPAITQTIGKASTSTSVATSISPSVSGQSVTFTATVSVVAPGGGMPGGSVTFLDGVTPLASGVALDGAGQATFSTAALAPGVHDVTVAYGGDALYSASTSTVTAQTVNQAATTTGLTTTGSPSVYGQSVTFTATVAAVAPGGGTPTGSVTFMDGAATIGNGTLDGSGQTTFSTATLGATAHSITAVYAGDTRFTSSASSALTQTVTQDATTCGLASTANPTVSGQSVTFTATVAGDHGLTPTGQVTFLDGATTLATRTLTNGSATAQTSALTIGAHTITAVYGGDTNFSAATSPAVTQQVNQADVTVTVGSSANPLSNPQPVTFTVTVSAASPATGVPSGTVTLSDGATVIATDLPLSNRQATYTPAAPLSVGAHTLTATYSGDSLFNPGSTVSPLTQQVSNTLWTATSSGTVLFGSPSGGAPSSVGFAAALLQDVAYDASGNLYVSANLTGTIMRRAFGSSTTTTFATGLGAPQGLGFDSSGTLYVADTGAGAILKVDTNGAVSTFVSGLSQPTGLAFDSADNLYTFSSNRLVTISPSGTVTPRVQFNGPTRLAVDSATNVFVADAADGAVYRVTPGDVKSTFASGLTNSLRGVAVDAQGNVYAVLNSGELYKYDSSGNGGQVGTDYFGARTLKYFGPLH